MSSRVTKLHVSHPTLQQLINTPYSTVQDTFCQWHQCLILQQVLSVTHDLKDAVKKLSEMKVIMCLRKLVRINQIVINQIIPTVLNGSVGTVMWLLGLVRF